MSILELVQQIARGRGLAVSLTFDPDADPAEQWVASVGLDAQGAGESVLLALGRALLDLDGAMYGYTFDLFGALAG